MSTAGAKQSLGFIGLGNMGGGICANLVSDGHEVHAFDTDPGALARSVEAGARSSASPAEVASASQITFLSLPTPASMEAVSRSWLEGAGTDAAGMGSARKVLVDLTTNSPSTVRAVGSLLARSGARLVEAPVTGGAPGARSRNLVFIVGCDDNELFADLEPLLGSIGRAVFLMGPLGTGNVGKLVNSLMAFTTMWVSLEGLALAAKNGIDLRTLVDMVRTSGGANSYLERRVEEISTRGRKPEFALELAAKDAGLMLEAGGDASVPMPVASALYQMLTYAKAQGLGGHDISDLVEVMERAADVRLELRPPEER